jgi:hypothetical protein
MQGFAHPAGPAIPASIVSDCLILADALALTLDLPIDAVERIFRGARHRRRPLPPGSKRQTRVCVSQNLNI